MKKFLIVGLLSVFLLTGCSYKEGGKIFSDDFEIIKIETDNNFRAYKVYDKETKVIYLFTSNGYSSGMTPLYNADGTLQIYEGE